MGNTERRGGSLDFLAVLNRLILQSEIKVKENERVLSAMDSAFVQQLRTSIVVDMNEKLSQLSMLHTHILLLKFFLHHANFVQQKWEVYLNMFRIGRYDTSKNEVRHIEALMAVARRLQFTDLITALQQLAGPFFGNIMAGVSVNSKTRWLIRISGKEQVNAFASFFFKFHKIDPRLMRRMSEAENIQLTPQKTHNQPVQVPQPARTNYPLQIPLPLQADYNPERLANKNEDLSENQQEEYQPVSYNDFTAFISEITEESKSNRDINTQLGRQLPEQSIPSQKEINGEMFNQFGPKNPSIGNDFRINTLMSIHDSLDHRGTLNSNSEPGVSNFSRPTPSTALNRNIKQISPNMNSSIGMVNFFQVEAQGIPQLQSVPDQHPIYVLRSADLPEDYGKEYMGILGDETLIKANVVDSMVSSTQNKPGFFSEVAN